MKKDLQQAMLDRKYKGEFDLESLVSFMVKDIGLKTIFFTDDGKVGCACAMPFAGYSSQEKTVNDAVAKLWIQVYDYVAESKQATKKRQKATDELKKKLEGWNSLAVSESSSVPSN